MEACTFVTRKTTEPFDGIVTLLQVSFVAPAVLRRSFPRSSVLALSLFPVFSEFR